MGKIRTYIMCLFMANIQIMLDNIAPCKPSTPQEQVYINEIMQFITEKVLIPSVIGVLITGFMYSAFLFNHLNMSH